MEPEPHSKNGYSFVAPIFDALWLFYPPVAVVTEIGLWVLLSALVPTLSTADSYLVGGGWFLLLALLWYFVIARIPDRVRLASIRRQILADRFAIAVRATRSAQLWIAETMRGYGITGRVPLGLALVAAPTRLEVWMGPQTDPEPVAVVAWSDVHAVEALPGHATVVRFVLGSTRFAANFRLVSTRRFGPVLLWGNQRNRALEHFELARQARVRQR